MAGTAPQSTPRSTTPVLIVGAGPTGLTLAIELARRGVPLRLIDKDPLPTRTSRALGTQARTVEVFGLMGIPEEALQPSAWPRAVRFVERGRVLARLAIGPRPDGAGPGILVMEQSDTERVLARRFEQLGGRIEQSVEFLRCRIDGNHVVATLMGPNGEWEERTRFLVGADGAHSAVRREAGIAFAGSSYPEQFLLADMDVESTLPRDEAFASIGDDGLAFVIPLPGERRYRLIVPVSPGVAKDYRSETDIATEAEKLVRQRTGIALRRVGSPIWASAFRVSRRQAERYRSGPVFLAGDAAHVHSPVGGQGMNTGIQDAFNLGWKLALAVRGQAAPGLLDTYQEERHPIARGVLRGTHIATRFYLSSNPIVHAFRGVAMQAVDRLMRLTPVRRRFLEAAAQLDVAYPDSPLSIDAAAADEKFRVLPGLRGGLNAGDRVPDATLRDVVSREPISLFGLISHGWVLLLFPGDAVNASAIDQLERLALDTWVSVGEAVEPKLVLDTPYAGETKTPVLLDPTGELSRTFGAQNGLVALVRPDGYLGYRGRPDQPGALASYLARVFAMRLRTAEDPYHDAA